MSSEKPQFTSADVTDPLTKWILSDDAPATKEENPKSDLSKSQRDRIRSVAEETTSSIDEHIPEWVVNNAITILAILNETTEPEAKLLCDKPTDSPFFTVHRGKCEKCGEANSFRVAVWCARCEADGSADAALPTVVANPLGSEARRLAEELAKWIMRNYSSWGEPHKIATALQKALASESPEKCGVTDLEEEAWGVIANAGFGSWDKESNEWQVAAARFRDKYHDKIKANKSPERAVEKCAECERLRSGWAIVSGETLKEMEATTLERDNLKAALEKAESQITGLKTATQNMELAHKKETEKFNLSHHIVHECQLAFDTAHLPHCPTGLVDRVKMAMCMLAEVKHDRDVYCKQRDDVTDTLNAAQKKLAEARKGGVPRELMEKIEELGKWHDLYTTPITTMGQWYELGQNIVPDATTFAVQVNKLRNVARSLNTEGDRLVYEERVALTEILEQVRKNPAGFQYKYARVVEALNRIAPAPKPVPARTIEQVNADILIKLDKCFGNDPGNHKALHELDPLMYEREALLKAGK